VQPSRTSLKLAGDNPFRHPPVFPAKSIICSKTGQLVLELLRAQQGGSDRRSGLHGFSGTQAFTHGRDLWGANPPWRRPGVPS